VKVDVFAIATLDPRSWAVRRFMRDDSVFLWSCLGHPLPLVERRDSHAVPATGRRAPSTPAVLARVIEESAATGICTFLHAGKIATTEQGSSRFAHRNEQLSRFLDVRLKSSLETSRSLEQSRGARSSANHVVNGLNGFARNRSRVNNFGSMYLTQMDPNGPRKPANSRGIP
jgi:hypothetical protein